jgi:hypothetical protein
MSVMLHLETGIGQVVLERRRQYGLDQVSSQAIHSCLCKIETYNYQMKSDIDLDIYYLCLK